MNLDRSLSPLALALTVVAFVVGGCGDSSAPGGATSGASARSAASTKTERGFPDEARERGVDYTNRSGTAAKSNILEANGAGVALLDLENDGDLDIVFAQGLPSLPALLDGPGADLEVFINDGAGHFHRAKGPGLSGWWTGLATGDIDGDGRADLVAGGFGQLVVLLQNEKGELVPHADLVASDSKSRLVPGEKRAAGAPPAWVTSLALFDADRDGVLDLYVGHYLELDPVAPPTGRVGEGALAIPCRWKGYDVFCGPHGLVPEKDQIFQGLGGGDFKDVTDAWYPTQVAGYTLGVVAFDADQDGDDDLYVANDSAPNNLLINDGHGHFSDRALAANVALSQDGAAQAGMGISFGDVDRDGQFDFVVTNFSGEPTELYLAAQRGYSRATYRFGLARETKQLLKWSTHLCDFDGDGWLELFTCNGHVYPEADREGTGTSYAQAATLHRLEPGDKAVKIEPENERSILFTKIGARGSAVGDLDGDLAPDLVIARIDAPAALGINRLDPDAHRLLVRCFGAVGADVRADGPRTPADGMGTRVVVVPKALPGETEHALIGEVETSQGFQSASSPWLHFGFGKSASYASLRVFWPSGRVEDLGAGAADRTLTIREGRGIVRAEPKR